MSDTTMQMPDGYMDADEKGSESFDFPPDAGYVFIIQRVDTRLSSNNNKQLCLGLDIAEGNYKGYYQQLTDKKGNDWFAWLYQNTEGETSLPYYKGLISSIEKSNPGYQYFNPQTRTANINTLLGKRFAALYQTEHNEETGKNKVVIKYPRSADKVGEIKVPIAKAKTAQSNSHGNRDIDNAFPMHKGSDRQPGEDDTW